MSDLVRGVARGLVRGVVRGVAGSAWGGPPPQNVTPPTIEGTATGGETLAVAAGTWSGEGEGMARSYQWYRDGVAIAGASDTEYLLTDADIGAEITVREYVSNASGTSSALSEAVGPVASPYILDNIPVAPITARSVYRVLTKDWLGNPLIMMRRADNQTMDFGAVDGLLDTTAIATWLGGSDGFLARVYDQSGNGLDDIQTTGVSQPLYVASAIGGKPGFSIADANDWLVNQAAALDNITAAGFCLHQVWRSGASLSPQTIWKGFGAAGWTCRGNGSGNYYFAQSGASSAKYWQRAMAIDTDYVDTLDYTGGSADNAVTRRTNGSVVSNIIFGSLTLPVGNDSAYDFSVGSTGAGGQPHYQSEIIVFGATLGADLQVVHDDAMAAYGL